MLGKVIVIGGSAAGPKTASRIRRMNQSVEITMIQKEPDLSMASCGYPYYIGGTFDERNQLLATPAGVVRDPNFFKNVKNINAKVNTEVIKIDRAKKTIISKDLKTGKEEELSYDKLIITTGSIPKKPPIEGANLEGVKVLKTMEDTDYLRKICDDGEVKNALVIGGGLIGIETAEAFKESNVNVTIIEMLPQILPFLDEDLAKIVEKHCIEKGVNIILQKSLKKFIGENGKLKGAELSDGTKINCEVALLSIGVAPNVKIAKEAGLKIGALGGIETNEFMQTSDENIYAAGDCIELTHRITNKKVLAPMGDLANLQGRVAADNIVFGNKTKFEGTYQTGICKVFDFAAGITGFSEREAKKQAFDFEKVVLSSHSKPGFMGGKILVSKMIADKKTKKILGFQCVGLGDVSRQVASASIALLGNLTIDNMANADMPYAPPFSLAIDHIITSAHILQNKLNGYFKGIEVSKVKEKLAKKEDFLFLDVRGENEFRDKNLGVGEKLIPLGALRKKFNELPSDKNKEIILYCSLSLRGYEAYKILEANGWKNIKIMEGGISAWY